MWQFKNASLHPVYADVTDFIAIINNTPNFFDPARPLFVGRAPGRLDLMGGIADYSGSLVLELPLAVATLAAVQLTTETEPTFRVRSLSAGELNLQTEVSLPMSQLLGCANYAEANVWLTERPATAWVAYLAGAMVVLKQELDFAPVGGVRLLVNSNVPAGKGVSSSAALEVAVMQALAGAYGLQIAGRDLALLCQKVENLVVGAPCGIMDQMTSACGQPNRLTALLCQPAELQPPVELPAELEVWGIDSGIRHAVVGADYGSVRVGAFMGYRIIADLTGLPVTPVDNPESQKVSIQDEKWNGYLANLAPSEWETLYRERLPHSLTGSQFLEKYGGFTDPVTRIIPQLTYAIRQPTAHPIYENHRVRLFRTLLQTRPVSEEILMLLGELMYQSHLSYSICGLGSVGTDRLVELVRQAGPAQGLYGAKITGGGSGGTVAVLARAGSKAVVAQIAQRYQIETGHPITVLGGSGAGAVEYGVAELLPINPIT